MPELEELAAQIAVCPACDLCRTRTQAVAGEGPVGASVFFIGEGPGYYEDKSGRPFVGPAGKFLDQLLGLAGLSRGDVFITNIVKCRPPNNRDPQEQEIEACRGWLDSQLEAIRPQVVVTLGRHSMGRYFPGESISRIHGQARKAGDITVVPMFHPAAALHQARYRSLIEEDFRKLPDLLTSLKVEARPAPPPEPPPDTVEPAEAQQMRLL